MIWVKVAKKYLAAFAAKDLDALEKLYADDINQIDWVCSIDGKDSVLMANASIFDYVGAISITIQDTAYRDKYICLEYLLVSDDGLEVNVASIVEVNDYGKIKSIRNYRR